MSIYEEASLLRLFVGESDKQDGMPLYEWLVRKAKEEKLAGTTVLRGLEGFGEQHTIHTARILQLSMDLPIIVEIIDTPAKIDAFMLIVDKVMKGGLATLEKVKMRVYGQN